MAKLIILYAALFAGMHGGSLAIAADRHGAASFQVAQSTDTEAERQKCERERNDRQARCLQNVTSAISSCQSGCSPSDEDASALATCQRECQDDEVGDRNACYTDESTACN